MEMNRSEWKKKREAYIQQWMSMGWLRRRSKLPSNDSASNNVWHKACNVQNRLTYDMLTQTNIIPLNLCELHQTKTTNLLSKQSQHISKYVLCSIELLFESVFDKLAEFILNNFSTKHAQHSHGNIAINFMYTQNQEHEIQTNYRTSFEYHTLFFGGFLP